ncbi:MAG TPA: adenylate/guanylate cyclase domain-containing protein, partial [Candidatus Dormibacteraeota bacterium]|nr:adenylate/guanylate cyclase domain-containing protein [Candidatus Dormibacteraeota bacterium]
MTFYEVLAQVLELLQREGRVSYRALKLQFNLDDDYLEGLKEELIEAKRVAIDEGGKVLAWVGPPAPVAPRGPEAGTAPEQSADPPASPGPIAYTPRHLAERILAEQAALAAQGAPDGERKTITALFADIKGSMALLEDLDPEAARRIIDPALQRMMAAVHRYEGYVAQSLGDGIFALFGAPIAHEDHAQRACYAALRMQEDLTRYAEGLRRDHGLTLEMRVGLNTGEVVVRSIRTDDLHTDYVPIGHATGLAARLQSLAPGGAIVVSERTYKLTEGYFAFTPLGAAQIKGVSAPVSLYEVAGVGPLRTRLEVAVRRGLVRFVGRQRELEQLERAWEQARGGRGQIVAVMGEAGLGKSRLCYEFKVRAAPAGLLLETFSVSHGKAYPYLPLIALLQHYFQLAPQDDGQRRREQVTGKVLTLDRRLEEALPYVLALLGDAEATAALAQMNPQLKRQRTFDAITQVLLRESLKQPLLLLIEDLHWLDRETEAWLHLLSERLATVRLLLLVNYRLEYQHAWGNKTYYTQLRLDPLGPAEAQELLTALVGDDGGAHGGAILQTLKHLILDKTEGNPFFIEEIVQGLVEQGVLVRAGGGGEQPPVARLARPLADIQLPATVQAVLTARIDRLPAAEKALLQTLAVVGKTFAWSLLARVVAQPEEELLGRLAHLRAAEFLYEQPAFPESAYTFKHALTQEVAYTSLLLERRQALHERTAQAIEALSADRLAEHYETLAHHYSRSGNTLKAVDYLQRAGQQAAQRSVLAEAITHLTAALDLLQTLPESPERLQQELALHLSLGSTLSIARGGRASPEVQQVYSRAYALCQQVGETPQVFQALRGLCMFAWTRGEHARGLDLAEQLLSLAQRWGDPAFEVPARLALGSALWWQGEGVAARDHLEAGRRLYDPQQHRDHVVLYGLDSGVACSANLGLVLWALGYADQALQHHHRALALARDVAHPNTLQYALTLTAMGHHFRREARDVQEQAEMAIALIHEQGLASNFVAMATCLQGWAVAAQGQREAGLALMRQGLVVHQASGQEIQRPWLLGMLAEACAHAGQRDEGL